MAKNEQEEINFNAFKLNKNNKPETYVPVSDSYATNGFTVVFQHVPSQKMVSFKAFISSFNESYNSDWASENVFGRPDPIYMYKSTTRSVSLALLVPAATTSESFENLDKVQQLVQFLYPTYTNSDQAQTISQSPLVRLRIMNLFADRSGATGDVGTLGTYNKMLSDAKTPGPSSEWLKGNLGVIGSLAINHNLENPQAATFEMAGGVVIPQLIELNLEFNVIHEHGLGWEGASGNLHFKQPLFPYGVNLPDSMPQSQTQAEPNLPQTDENTAAASNGEAKLTRLSQAALRRST